MLHVVEGERADDHVYRVIGQRQPVQLAETELPVGHPLPRAGQNVGGS
jgi:hypothetical protein